MPGLVADLREPGLVLPFAPDDEDEGASGQGAHHTSGRSMREFWNGWVDGDELGSDGYHAKDVPRWERRHAEGSEV